MTPSNPEPQSSSISEEHWLANVQRKGEAQLTMRAVVMGMLLGVLMCVSNLYVFFKTGWSMGVTITAGILAFAVCSGMRRLGLAKRPLGALENNALTTVASGAGYMTGGGNMAAYGALLMVSTLRPEPLPMVLWFGTIAALGVFAAIPIKRQLINRENLAFPTGTATAETLRVLHGESASQSERDAGAKQTKALALAALCGALLAFVRDMKASWMPFNLPSSFSLPFSLAGHKAIEWTLALKAEVVLLGAGALMSFRTGWSLLLGSLLTYGVLAPALFEQGIVTEVKYKAIVGWSVWPGAALLVSAGLTSFALDWRSVARSFSGLAGLFGKRKDAKLDPLDAIECPGWWFPAGFALLAPVVVSLMAWLFQVPLWAGLIAVPLAVVMGFVAARVTGETDVTPTKALGPVTQLVFGVITPGNLSGNIMSANVTGGIGLHAADLLTTLKTGWILGANPRAQFYAQLFGVLAGAAIIVPAFNLLVPDPSVLGGEDWPAPSCAVWASVSEAFSKGIGSLPSGARSAALVGLLLGVLLALLEKFAPPRLKPFVPSASGLGIAMVVPGSNGISMFLGALAAEICRRKARAFAARYVTPIASGLIAGESLMGVVVVLVLTLSA